MILPQLLNRFRKHRDDEVFYAMQAQDAVRWLREKNVPLGRGTTAIDLGCGHGIFGLQLIEAGCDVTFADEECYLMPQVASRPFKTINLDREPIEKVGVYDLAICSNVLEHLAKPDLFISSVQRILKPGGHLYLSWTNWLSPWGGHEFSPLHYLGASRGHLLYDKLTGRKRKHTPFKNLFPTYIGSVLQMIRANPQLAVQHAAPRYYTEFAFLIQVPVFREFFAWNCAILIQRRNT